MSDFCEIIQRSLVCLNRTEETGKDLLEGMLEDAVRAECFPSERLPKVLRAVMNRELSASTALPDGIALPHGRTPAVSELHCLIGIHPSGVPFGAEDGSLTKIFILLLVPVTMGCAHIQFLAKLSRCLLEPSVRKDLLEAKDREEVIRAILSHVEEGN